LGNNSSGIEIVPSNATTVGYYGIGFIMLNAAWRPVPCFFAASGGAGHSVESFCGRGHSAGILPAMQLSRRRGFTLVELLVVIGIIALLISILIPVLGRARDQANKVACMSNLRQVAIGFMLYAGSNKDMCPFGSRSDNQGNADLPEDWVHYRGGIANQGLWSSAIAPFLSGKGSGLENVLRCPSDNFANRDWANAYTYSYVMNMYYEPRPGFFPPEGHPPVRLSTTKRASEKILLAEENERTINDGFWAPGNYLGAPVDGNPEANWVVNWDWLSIRHDNTKKEAEPPIPNTGPLLALPNLYARGQVCFADGHVDYVSRRQAHSPQNLLPRMP
jgi:prepilin-type N-terminal cleavage/methylation domain-containing protein/prepilin-type processing-associated H-X9-DG protein